MKETLFIVMAIVAVFVLLPILIFLCMKFGVIAFYKAKQYIEKEQQITKKGTLYEQKKEE